MAVGTGIALIAGGAALSLLVLLITWRRLSPPVAYALLVACGVVIGAGGLLVQDEAGAGSWLIATVTLGTLSPFHGRLVFGRPGPAA
jgi:hypothetical protein